jgi:hypothetical protein
MLPGHVQVGNFIEVDYPMVTSRKCHMIKKSRVLLEKIAPVDEDGDVRLSGKTDLHGSDYHVVGADFTNLSSLEKKLAECNVDYGRPTIFLAECVLVYVGAKETSGLMRWCADKFAQSPLVFINHEEKTHPNVAQFLCFSFDTRQLLSFTCLAIYCLLDSVTTILTKDTLHSNYIHMAIATMSCFWAWDK